MVLLSLVPLSVHWQVALQGMQLVYQHIYCFHKIFALLKNFLTFNIQSVMRILDCFFISGPCVLFQVRLPFLITCMSLIHVLIIYVWFFFFFGNRWHWHYLR